MCGHERHCLPETLTVQGILALKRMRKVNLKATTEVAVFCFTETIRLKEKLKTIKTTKKWLSKRTNRQEEIKG